MNQQRGSSATGSSATGKVKAGLDHADRFQQQRRPLAVTLAVFRKFTEDRSTNLAAMIAFWAFFSIFPLLLVFITILGYALPEGTKQSVLRNVGSMFPMLDISSVGSLGGAWWPLIVGGVTALWSGSAVVRVTQFAFNSVWEKPYREHPKLIGQLGRSLWVLATIGLGLVISTLISGFVTGAGAGIDLGWWGRLIGYAIAIVLDVALFVAAFRILTAEDVTTRDVLPGALLSGVAFWILQQVSSLIISRYLQNAQSTYGGFATVITMLWWFYLQSVITLLGAQLNVVLKRKLYPRAMVNPPGTEADRRAYREYARERTYVEDEQVHVELPEDEPQRGDLQ